MKRFTETLKWTDPWYRKLTPPAKLIWQWILDNCDHAGVIDLDLELAAFQIGYQYPNHTLLKAFEELGDRVMKLDCGKYFIPKFIQFQYGALSKDCKAHNPVFQSLQKYELKGYPKGIQGVSIPPKTGQGQDKDKDNSFLPSLDDAIQMVMTVGIPDDFCRYIYDDWYSRSGKDAGGVNVRFQPYATKRWAREQNEWRKGTHKGNKKAALKPTVHLRDMTYDSTQDPE